jgi:acetyl-CoA carboxylase carboxyl transferase subunit beta
MVYGKRFARNLKVCPDCGHHHRLLARERVDQLFDPGTVKELDVPVFTQDVLSFVDTKPYPERLSRHVSGPAFAKGLSSSAATSRAGRWSPP